METHYFICVLSETCLKLYSISDDGLPESLEEGYLECSRAQVWPHLILIEGEVALQ